MRQVIRAAFLALAAALVIAYFARHAPAQEIHFPSNLSIEGLPVCAGPPNAGDPLIFNGSQWCNFIPNNVCETFRNNAGAPQCAIRVDNLNQVSLGDGTNAVVTRAGSQFIVNAQGLFWGNGGDRVEVNAPRSTATFFSPTALTNVSVAFGSYTPGVAIHVTGIDLALNTPAAGCTTSAVVQLNANGANQAASSITVANTTSHFRVTGLTIANPTNTQIFAQVTTAAAGCTTPPSNTNYLIEFTTD